MASSASCQPARGVGPQVDNAVQPGEGQNHLHGIQAQHGQDLGHGVSFGWLVLRARMARAASGGGLGLSGKSGCGVRTKCAELEGTSGGSVEGSRQ